MHLADPNVSNLAHYTITVRSIRTAEAFYSGVMGADVLRRSWNPEEPDPVHTREEAEASGTTLDHGRRFSQFELGSVIFDAFEEPFGPWPEQRNVTQHPHYAFEVTSLAD
ncbi:MAG TPA: VOC family protein, partial [Chloroflexota bacterium]|nr:VOC family protein [Chloroflexota bacterium]